MLLTRREAIAGLGGGIVTLIADASIRRERPIRAESSR